jgi:hypothetical protein
MTENDSIPLDSPAALIAELTNCNQEIGEFEVAWAQAAGLLKAKEKRFERLYKSGLRGTTGRNAEERQATAHAAVEEVAPGLAEELEGLVGEVEEYKTRFKAIDRRSNNAQSLLSLHKEAARLESFVPRTDPSSMQAARNP